MKPVASPMTNNLKFSEKQYRQMVESLPFGIFIQKNNTIIFANAVLIRLFGVTNSADLIGRSFYDFIHPDYRVVLEGHIKQLINEGDTAEMLEEQLIRADGITLDVEIGATVHDVQDGILLQITVKDITDRKQAAQALSDSEEKFRTLAETMPQCVWTARPDGWIDYSNTRFIEYTGLTAEQALGTSWEKVLHPDDVEVYRERWRESVATGQKYEIEYRYQRGRDGAYRWHLARAMPIRDSKGNLIKWIGTSTDIDDQKRAEEEVIRLNEQLEKRVADRTTQLETVIAELESFSYSVSHDLRAPLRHVVSFIDLLEKHLGAELDEKALRYIATIAESASRMQQLIDDLLEFSRMGRADMQKQVVNINGLIDNVLQDFTEELASRELVWKIEALPEVYADPVLLKQVFINLIGNALKFSRNQQPAEITIGSLPTQSAETVIYIKDNGVGFDMTYADKLFGVFQRLHSKNEFEGTGIGLANVQRIIQRHSGRVWAESKVGEGATFYFALIKAQR